MKARLTRIVSSHDSLRTPVVEGRLFNVPKVGDRIQLLTESLDGDPAKVRHIITTPVTHIEDDLYFTAHSTYRLEILPE